MSEGDLSSIGEKERDSEHGVCHPIPEVLESWSDGCAIFVVSGLRVAMRGVITFFKCETWSDDIRMNVFEDGVSSIFVKSAPVEGCD
jgi:hypothetical protein